MAKRAINGPTRHGEVAPAPLASPPDRRARAHGPAGQDAGEWARIGGAIGSGASGTDKRPETVLAATSADAREARPSWLLFDEASQAFATLLLRLSRLSFRCESGCQVAWRVSARVGPGLAK
jgi:hypothetical protein